MLELTWQEHADTVGRPVLVVRTDTLARLTAPAIHSARCLLSPDVLRHAEPVLCAAAEATGVGVLGQWVLRAAVRLTQQALDRQ